MKKKAMKGDLTMKAYNIGLFIKKKREEQHIRQEDLCRGICDKSTLSRIERGK